jgi:hypothetical protein
MFQEVLLLKENPEMIYKMLINLKSNMSDDIGVNPLIYYVEHCLPEEGAPKELPSHKAAIKNIINVIFEMFPPPFYVG